ncbi:MAG: hypothetical protein HYW24_04825 [Candidatus Aenigmarchaeota archaeon]|nr:hypothetical protein [Candidatus Aenigmarchaeota archaeon]
MHNRHNPHDEDFIDRIDSYLLSIHERIGKYWQDKTYKSKNVLTRFLYLGSSFGFLTAAVASRDPQEMLMSLAPLYLLIRNSPTKYKKLFDWKISKTLNMAVCTLGGMGAIYGLSNLGYGIISDDKYAISNGLFSLGYGLGAEFISSALYLERANLDDPPKRPKRKPINELLKEKLGGLLPQPRLGHSLTYELYQG